LRGLPVWLGLASAPFAGRLTREAGIATAAAGFIPGPKQADDIVQNGQLDKSRPTGGLHQIDGSNSLRLKNGKRIEARAELESWK